MVLHLAQPGHRAVVRDLGCAPQVGFVVSKAVGDAVTRNRVKRRLRHLVRARVETLPGGSVTVVRALPASATATYDALERDLEDALGRMGPTAAAASRGRTG